MSLNETLLKAVVEAIQLNPSVITLRQQFPDLHFTECSDDDVSPRVKPVLTLEQYNLYLVSGKSGHCLEFTTDLASATGVVVAARDDEE
jgi:hypothetical protein